jgi:ribose 5-phosphate isomerase B
MSHAVILLVCAANRCRSPLAEALLNRLLSQSPAVGKVRVESAGLHALPDLPATPWAQAAAQEVGLDLRQHRSRSIDQLALDSYALVLTMEEVQAEALVATHPARAQQILQLSALVKMRVDIEDPTGRGLREHRALCQVLERYLQAGLPQLLQRLSM